MARAAAVGLELAPGGVRAEAILKRLEDASQDQVPALLSSLPPLAERAEIESVARWLSNEDDRVRVAAADALSRADADPTLAVLESMRQDAHARLGVAMTYSRMGNSRCTPLLDMLKDPDAEVRAAAAEGVGRCGLATVPQIREALDREPSPRAARALIGALGRAGGAEAVKALASVLEAGDPGLRFEAVHALGMTASPGAFAPLLTALDDPDPGVRTVALAALGNLGDVRAEEPIARHIADPDRDRTRHANRDALSLHGRQRSGDRVRRRRST